MSNGAGASDWCAAAAIAEIRGESHTGGPERSFFGGKRDRYAQLAAQMLDRVRATGARAAPQIAVQYTIPQAIVRDVHSMICSCAHFT